MRQSQVSNQKIRVQTLLKRQGFLRSRMAHELQYASCRMNDKIQHIQLLTMQIQDLIASKSEAEKQITELISLNQKLISQAAKKDAIVAELTSAKEKEAHIEKMTLKLSKITQELVFQNSEKERRFCTEYRNCNFKRATGDIFNHSFSQYRHRYRCLTQ